MIAKQRKSKSRTRAALTPIADLVLLKSRVAANIQTEGNWGI